MIGYEWTIGKFLYFYYFIFMCFTYHTALGMMLVSLTPRHEIASVFMTLFATFWNLFAGFFLPRPVCHSKFKDESSKPNRQMAIYIWV